MVKFWKLQTRIGAAVVTALLAALIPATQASAGAVNPPVYLSLGDSLAYGFHAAQFASEFPNINPATFDDGYVNDFGAALRIFRPNLQLINDACPGETSSTFITGSGIPGFCGGGPAGTPFPDIWLHHPYSNASPTDSQLADALAILDVPASNVTTITLDIGSNDVVQFLEHDCGFPLTYTCTPTEVESEFSSVLANVTYIVATLSAAAPHAKIVLLGLYDPYPLALPSPGGDELVLQLNAGFARVAALVPNASFANPEPAFNPAGYQGKSEIGDLPTICAFTAMCPGGVYNPISSVADIHPTRLGYGVLASVVALDYLTHR